MSGHPLYGRAELYDAAFGWDAAPEAAFYARVLGPGRLLDVGCGTGRVLAALAALGRDVVGLEVEPAAAERARARGLDVVVGDMRTFVLQHPVDGAFSHLSTFRHLLDDRDVASHLRAMAAALPRPGSLYAVDHDLVGSDFDPRHPGQTWTMPGPGGAPVTTTWRALGAPRGGLVLEECVLRCGTTTLRHEEELRAWTAESLEAAVARHGAFSVAAWYAAPFEIAAPFVPVPWTPADRTCRVVTVLVRR
jgi:SAM-dependent methyltransferase